MLKVHQMPVLRMHVAVPPLPMNIHSIVLDWVGTSLHFVLSKKCLLVSNLLIVISHGYLLGLTHEVLCYCSSCGSCSYVIWHSEECALWYILITKANEMHYFSNLFDKVLYMFLTCPVSIIRSISTLHMQEVFVILVLLASASRRQQN